MTFAPSAPLFILGAIAIIVIAVLLTAPVLSRSRQDPTTTRHHNDEQRRLYQLTTTRSVAGCSTKSAKGIRGTTRSAGGRTTDTSRSAKRSLHLYSASDED